VICEPWSVVVVPFPFVDRREVKRRPALVLSQADFNRAGHSILAMVTTQAHHPWPGDVTIGDLGAAGLKVGCIVRLKLFTLDNRLIERELGQLSKADRSAVDATVSRYLR
jgi:mRNA interferase MazF